MVKTYQLSKEGNNGKSLKVAPVTTESQLNKETCLEVDGSSDMSITPQAILPDLSGFEVRTQHTSYLEIFLLLNYFFYVLYSELVRTW